MYLHHAHLEIQAKINIFVRQIKEIHWNQELYGIIFYHQVTEYFVHLFLIFTKKNVTFVFV